LILTEFPIIEVENLLHSEEKMRKCDILCILYDNEAKGESFLRDNGPLIPDYVPRLIVRTKCDLMPKSSSGNLDLSKSVKLEATETVNISVKVGNIEEFKGALLSIIEKPIKSLPASMVLKLKESSSIFDNTSKLITIGLGIIGITVLIIYGIKKRPEFLRSFIKR